MNKKNLVAGAAAGTIAMTIFSYFLAGKKNKDFREPALLGKMIRRGFPAVEKAPAEITGWILHIGTGFLFASFSKELINKFQSPEDLSNNIAVGTVNGIAGVIAWKLAFSLHPDPPKIHYSHFYQQLVLAHIIFTAASLSVMNDDGKEFIEQ